MINTQFLEFWGTFLLNAAKGQKQLDQMANWMQKGLSSADELAGMFKKFYCLEPPPEPGPDNSALWQQAIAGFEQSFRQYAEQWGWIPLAVHKELGHKCETLEKTIEKQNQTIDQLRKLLEIKGLGGDVLMERFQSLVKNQSEQFGKLMGKLGQSISAEPKEDR